MLLNVDEYCLPETIAAVDNILLTI